MKNTKLRKMLGFACLVFTILGWGLSFLGTERLLNDYSPIEIILFRYILSYIGLFLLNPRPFLFKEKKFEFYCFLASIAGVSIYQWLENIAIENTNASNVSVIIACSCFFTAIFSTLILKSEKIGVNFMAGFICSIIGVVLVSFNGKINLEFNPFGDFITLGCAVLWGLYSVCVSKINEYKYNLIQTTRRLMIYGILVIIPLFIIFGGKVDFTRFTQNYNYMWFLFLGILCGSICFMTWNYAVDTLGPVKTSLAMYVQPIVTIIFGFILFNHKITLMGACGALIVVAGLFLSSSHFLDNLFKKKKEEIKEEPIIENNEEKKID